MKQLLAVRDSLSRFYGKYDTPVRLFLKFAAAFVTFLSICAALSQANAADHPLILLGLAAACAFLPSNAVILAGAALILRYFYGISLEAAVVGGGILVVALLLYFSMAPRSAWPLVFTALALGVDMGCVPAVLFGLVGGPLQAMGAAFGALIYYLTDIAKQYGGSLQATATEPMEAMLQKMAELIQAVISHREMPVMMAALAAALVTVYLLRGLAVKYAWIMAAAAGCAVYAAVRVCGLLLMRAELRPVPLAAEIAVSLAAAWLAQTMLFCLDYKKTESVRFEDDEYYYYVKAVPKKKIRRKKRKRRAEGR